MYKNIFRKTTLKIMLVCICILVISLVSCTPKLVEKVVKSLPIIVPGQVLGLRHNMNQEKENSQYMAFFTASRYFPVRRFSGGDLKAPLHRGYDWWMVNDDPESDPSLWELPPGIVLGLKHSIHQGPNTPSVFGKNSEISVFGNDPCTGPPYLKGGRFKRECGGDLGAPANQGYYWYESTGIEFNNWELIAHLPRWTVVCLKHSRNQKDKKIIWKGRIYDPADRTIAPPTGFKRRSGGDRNGSSGEGFYWYEKITGPEIVKKPKLQVKLSRSLYISLTDGPNMDIDKDGLIDSQENQLALNFRPYLIFDKDEKFRIKPHEPVTLFRVWKMNIDQIGIKWVFLFKTDGGYGPDSYWCGGSHGGDTDDALFELRSNDNGLTWTIERVILATWKGSNAMWWPLKNRMEVYDLTHPIIYMSAHKHHEYFVRDNDHNASFYSSVWCHDDVNGLGDKFLVNIQSINKHFNGYNNVGELNNHATPPFANKLDLYYTDHSAWGNKNFYSSDAGVIKTKWLK